MNKPLQNKFALVTGSSRGIGAATATRLAAEGAAVVVNYNASPGRAKEVVTTIRRAGGEAEAIGADLGTGQGVQTLIASLDRVFGGKFAGRLDILVNNAGTVEFGLALADTSDASFDRHFNLNVRAPFQLSREAARRMAKAGWGRIINIGSCFGEAAPLPGLALYCGTKFAVQGLTRAWSRELGSAGVTVNDVQPGPTNTELSPDNGSAAAETMKKLTSVGRFGKPEEIAAAVAFLASPESAFINGESLTVDGGWNA